LTHEKFLVCDQKFAMLTSHNFFTSDERKGEREIGLKIYHPHIIRDLIDHFERARDWTKLEGC
jgi:phosphatidylserine/phosphatidylglycerophosphate/cardiolipin synthase-like enzyme